MKFFYKSTLVFLLFILVGCRNFEIYPFISFHKDNSKTEFSLRPLFQITFDKKKNLTRFMFIPPLVDYKRKKEDKKFRIFPIFYWIDKKQELGIDRDVTLFPIVFGGVEPGQGIYFCIFPLGGNLKDFMAKDEIWFVLFPLYTYAKDKDYKTHNILFPLVLYGKGKNRKSFRILPFYSKMEKKNRYERKSFFWPFFNFSKEGLNTKDPIYGYFFFPFFGRKKSKNISAYTVLWPLFAYGRDKKRNYVAWDVLWVMYQHAKGKDLEKNYFGPLYGHKTIKDKSRTSKVRDKYLYYYVLFPIFQKETEDFVTFKKHSLWILPFYWHSKNIYEKDKRYDSYVKFWPIVRYAGTGFRDKKAKDGTVDIRAISLLPFLKDNDLVQFYSPLWRVFEYQKSKEKTKFSLLWRLFKYERKKDKWNLTLLWFITL